MIEKNVTIFIPYQLKKIKREIYNEKTLLLYENRSKIINWTSNEVDFETVRDLGDPTSQWFPFIFHDWNTK